MYFIHKQLIPTDTNQSDPNWAKRQIWVLKLNPNDTIDSFDTIEEAEEAKNSLQSEDPSGRVYKVVVRNENGTYSDI
jgi:hypothetical protein